MLQEYKLLISVCHQEDSKAAVGIRSTQLTVRDAGLPESYLHLKKIKNKTPKTQTPKSHLKNKAQILRKCQNTSDF